MKLFREYHLHFLHSHPHDDQYHPQNMNPCGSDFKTIFFT